MYVYATYCLDLQILDWVYTRELNFKYDPHAIRTSTCYK